MRSHQFQGWHDRTRHAGDTTGAPHIVLPFGVGHPLEALRQVKRLKPFYSGAQIALGISKAKEFLFQPTQKDLEDLKKETGIWQRASLKTLEH